MTHIAQHFTGSFVVCYVICFFLPNQIYLKFKIFSFGNLILFRAHLKMEYTSYAMISCGITYLAVAISLVFILDKVGRRSLFLCK